MDEEVSSLVFVVPQVINSCYSLGTPCRYWPIVYVGRSLALSGVIPTTVKEGDMARRL